MSETIEQLSELIQLRDTLNAETEKIGEHSTPGERRLKSVLTSLVVDLHVLILLAGNKLPGVKHADPQVRRDYSQRTKRAFLRDVWSITTERVRQIGEELAVEVPGRGGKTRKYIDDALELVRSREARSLLTRARRNCQTTSDEFPALLAAVLKARLGRVRAHEWSQLFEILEALCHASDHGFRTDRTRSFRSPWYSKTFSKDQEVGLRCEDMARLTEALKEFFKEVES